ncbi:MAG: ABC transporter ATP-binding protein [Bullifex sp.]
MEKLKAENLSVKYKNFTLDLSFSLEEGEFVSVLGPSGSGKSTVLSIIAGLNEAFSGKLYLNGRDITHERVQDRNISIVFQNYALFSNMNVERNVAYALKMKKTGRKETQEKVSALLSLVGLTGYEKRKISTLSGGECQRVALARALAKEPEVLLLDEPLSALDAALRKRLKGEIRRIHECSGNMTTLYVTHDREEAFSISDRIIIMKDGHVEATGTPEQLYRNPPTLFTAMFTGEGTSMSPACFGYESEEIDKVFFRPENVIIREGQFWGDLDQYITLENAEVLSLDYLGSHYLLLLRYNGHDLLAESDTRPDNKYVNAYIRKSGMRFYKDDKLI